VRFFPQASAQQQPLRLEVVLKLGQAQRAVGPDLAVREIDLSAANERLQHVNEKSARHALDEVVMLDEDAVIVSVVDHPDWPAGIFRWQSRHGRVQHSFGRIRLAERDGRRQLARNQTQSRFVLRGEG